jgi:hypothetical protein
MTPKPEHDRDAVILARVLREREWCYAGWLAHKTWTQLRVEAARPESEGGLGYDLSIQAIKGLVEAARADRGDLHLDRDAHIERELHDLELLQQEAMRAVIEQRNSPPVDAQGNLKLFAIDAAKFYAELGEKRRKLLGLDAATKIEAEVTHRDAVTEELNAMLARAGREPIEGKTQP